MHIKKPMGFFPDLARVCTLLSCIACAGYAARPGFAESQNVLPASTQRFSLNVRDADIRDVLTMVSEQFNLNMVVSDDVSGLVTLRLEDVTLHGALQAILTSRGFDYETSNNIVRIASAEILSGERTIRQEREGLEPLISEVITLSYLDAKDVEKVVQGLLSPRGTVAVVERRNLGGFEFGAQAISTGASGSAQGGEGLVRSRRSGEQAASRSRMLLVSDTRSNVERIKTIIRSVDIRPNQILIDAKILEVETDTLEDLGIEFDSRVTIPSQTKEFPNPLDIDINQGTSGVLFPSSSSQGLNVQFSKLVGENFSTVLHALLQDDRTRTLSSPSILVLDGQEATILVGEQFPIFESTVSDQGTATESLSFFQPVGISLQVIPQITADNNISMIIHPTVSSVGQFVTGSTGLTQPRINIREADTQVLIRNDETIVIGGLLEDVTVEHEFRIPVLGHLPGIGALFTRKQTDIDQKNLIVFITPRIIEPTDGLSDLRQKEAFLGLSDPDRYGSLQERRANIKRHVESGKYAFKTGDFELAAYEFNRALRLDPDNGTAQSYLKKLNRTVWSASQKQPVL